MTKQTINKISVFISLLITFFSTIVALLSGGDLFFVIAIRFLLVFVASMAISWTALTVISSVVIGAARTAIDELKKEIEEEARSARIKNTNKNDADENNKGKNLDLTSVSSDSEDLLNATDSENPEVEEFEPFKPHRIDADTADSGR